MSGLKMAKSSPEEMEKMLAFFNGLEAIFEGEFEMNPLDDYATAQEEAVGKYVVEWWEKFLDGSWGRFYWGFDTLLRSAADPDLTYLDWKPEIKSALDAQERAARSEEEEGRAKRIEDLEFTDEQIAEAIDTWKNFLGFSGRTCEECGKTANVVNSFLGWLCACGHFNTASYRERQPAHELPDFGPSREVILLGYRASRKHRAISDK